MNIHDLPPAPASTPVQHPATTPSISITKPPANDFAAKMRADLAKKLGMDPAKAPPKHSAAAASQNPDRMPPSTPSWAGSELPTPWGVNSSMMGPIGAMGSMVDNEINSGINVAGASEQSEKNFRPSDSVPAAAGEQEILG